MNMNAPEKPKEMLVTENLSLRESVVNYREQVIDLREEICDLKEEIVRLKDPKHLE